MITIINTIITTTLQIVHVIIKVVLVELSGVSGVRVGYLGSSGHFGEFVGQVCLGIGVGGHERVGVGQYEARGSARPGFAPIAWKIKKVSIYYYDALLVETVFE